MVSATAYQMDEAEKERERQNQIGKSVEQTREFSSFCTNSLYCCWRLFAVATASCCCCSPFTYCCCSVSAAVVLLAAAYAVPRCTLTGTVTLYIVLR